VLGAATGGVSTAAPPAAGPAQPCRGTTCSGMAASFDVCLDGAQPAGLAGGAALP